MGCYFGGHTIVRQGFQTYEVQGVEFYQLGQGGKIGHYPVHFHLARETGRDRSHAYAFVKDSSIWDSDDSADRDPRNAVYPGPTSAMSL